MTVYYELRSHNNERIGRTIYFKVSAAKSAAKRLAGKWRNSNDLRGNGIKIVENDSSKIWDNEIVVEWVFSV